MLHMVETLKYLISLKTKKQHFGRNSKTFHSLILPVLQSRIISMSNGNNENIENA